MLTLRASTDPVDAASNIDVTLRPPDARSFRLLFLRMHFRGGSGTADVTISLDSAAGDEWDATLKTLSAKGIGADVNYCPTLDEAAAWQFVDGDGLRIQWTNPGTVTYWAVEMGYEPR